MYSYSVHTYESTSILERPVRPYLTADQQLSSTASILLYEMQKLCHCVCICRSIVLLLPVLERQQHRLFQVRDNIVPSRLAQTLLPWFSDLVQLDYHDYLQDTHTAYFCTCTYFRTYSTPLITKEVHRFSRSSFFGAGSGNTYEDIEACEVCAYPSTERIVPVPYRNCSWITPSIGPSYGRELAYFQEPERLMEVPLERIRVT